MKIIHTLAAIAAWSVFASVAAAQDVGAGASQAALVGVDPQLRLDPAAARAALAPYGTWVTTGAYGDVWVPAQGSVGPNFVPYGTQGHWVQSDAGWYWQSDFPWGSIAFHYGRWVRLETGWAWAPGDSFAPAWVDWRMTQEGLVGWAPLPPSGLPDAIWYAYLQPSMLGAVGFWPSAFYGAAGMGYYPRSYALPRATGYGGVPYAYGPRVNTGTVPVRQAWQRDMNVSRIGSPPAQPFRMPAMNYGYPRSVAPAVRFEGPRGDGFRGGFHGGGFHGGGFHGGSHGGGRR